MEIVPTYLVFPSQQGNKLAWTMPMLLQAGSNLEDVTRANLFPFMVSKELYGSVQHNPQLHSSSIHPRHHTPLHHTWQPASSSPTWSTMAKSKHVRRDNDAENDPVTSTGDSSSYVTDDDSNIPRNKRIRHNRSHHISSTHPIVLTQSLKSNTPWKHLSFRKQQERPLTKFQIYDWVNDLNSLWYLMEQGKYTQNEHERLISLLRKINKERDRPGLDLKWLKESKLVEVLKKYRKEESLHEYDPWVRRTASQIIRAWKARFEVHSNS
ncbi:hypothetical protein APHAL10511_002098 [Amanita phalloides]|nr:hypothetical protein APHAL10511_002098 [Amanita phalloides]